MTRSRWLLLIALAPVCALLHARTGRTDGHPRIRVAGESARNNLFAVLALFFIAEVVLVALSIPIGIWMSALAAF